MLAAMAALEAGILGALEGKEVRSATRLLSNSARGREAQARVLADLNLVEIGHRSSPTKESPFRMHLLQLTRTRSRTQRAYH